MKIVMRDHRKFHGTPIQIVRAMQDIAFGAQGLSVRKYIEWVAENTRQFDGIELAIKGETDDELAASLVDEMLRAGLTVRL